MTIRLDKSSWKRLRLGDVICRSREQVDPFVAGVARYVAGGHIDSDSLTIDRWGEPNDGQMGSTFRYTFEPGQVLFVSARPYLRKFGVVDFSGVVADKTYVLDAIPENGLLQEFLPFVLSSEPFAEYARTEATGSMNPRLLWGPMQRYEVDLPPLDEQKRIANLLWAIENARTANVTLSNAIAALTTAAFDAFAVDSAPARLDSWVDRIDAGRSPRAAAEPANAEDLGVLKVSAVGRDAFVASENKRLLDRADFRPTDVVRAGDVLVTRANAVVDNVARPCMVDRDFPNLMLSDKTLRLVPNTCYPGRVLLAALRAPAFRAYVREVVNGTEAKNISQTKILSGPVPDLDPDAVRGLSGQLSACDAASLAANTEGVRLRNLKDAVMAEIFGGN